jgi:hypothetical protein
MKDENQLFPCTKNKGDENPEKQPKCSITLIAA